MRDPITKRVAPRHKARIWRCNRRRFLCSIPQSPSGRPGVGRPEAFQRFSIAAWYPPAGRGRVWSLLLWGGPPGGEKEKDRGLGLATPRRAKSNPVTSSTRLFRRRENRAPLKKEKGPSTNSPQNVGGYLLYTAETGMKERGGGRKVQT